ncbi:translocation/assembly module TamB domain-containing protein [Pseudoalteromonas sp. KAN5]|uniref:autotransporter assembly complex protein TamB n=1 Tax=Pseudoalteromonas sp. KAN5 TaxID=2916633 RepID=UPI001FCB46D2|nr:translocation/assembly module TamB domain-containing protein [Pseudoalteromonas sp. KAN5]BDF94740.1 translocation/assembly module TamB [Pseudoalteromonas sp. KAN5]
MSKMKKITTALTLFFTSLLVLVFCLLFTAPGNQLIAYTATKLVDGLRIDIKNGRFLYNDSFDVRFQSDGLDFNAKNLKLDLYWWGCEGICIENMSAQAISLKLPQPTQTQAETEEEARVEEQPATSASDEISLPIGVSIKRIAIASFELDHASANVSVKKFVLAAFAQQSLVTLSSLKIAQVDVLLKETQAPPSEPLTALAALPDIHFSSPLAAKLEQLLISKVTLVQGEQSHEISDIKGSFAINKSELQLPSFSADYLQWHLASQLTANLADDTPVTAALTLNNPEHQVALAVAGDLRNLQLDVITEGQYPLTAKINADLKTTNFPFSINANIEQWLLEVESNQLKINDVQLTGKGNADDYTLQLMAQSQLAAYPKVRLESALKGGLTHINVEQLSLMANESKATLTASASWENGIESQFSGKLANLKAQYLTDTVSSDLSGQFNGVFNASQQQWQLKMIDTQLGGTVDDIPFSFVSDFDLNNSLHASIEKFELVSGENKLALSGNIAEQWKIKGLLHLNKPEQKNLPFTGVGEGKLAISGARLQPIVNLDVGLRDLSFADIQIANLALKTDFNYAADWQTNVSLKVTDANVAGQQINSFTIAAAGDKDDHQLQLDLNAVQGKAELEVAGKFAKNVWQGSLSNVLLSDNVIDFTTKPAVAIKFNIDTGDFSVQQHCWQSQNSKLCIDRLNQTAQLGQLNAKLENFDLTEIKHLLPDNIITEGGFAGQVKANWQASQLQSLSATINSHDLAAILINEEKRYRLPIDTFTLNAIADPRDANLQARLSSTVLGDINADIDAEDLAGQQLLSGQLVIDKILLTDLQPFIGTLEQLKGSISGQIALAGTLSAPLLNGELEVIDVNLQGEQLPVAIVDSNISITFDKTKATLDGKLNDAQGGKLALEGDIDWQGAQPAVNLAVVGEQFYVRAQQGVTFKVSPDLKIGLADNAFKLAGQVVVPYGRIEIEELPEGAVQVSDDEIIIDKQAEQTQAVPFDYDISLKLIVENDVRIDSFGLESKIEGDLSIKMDQQTPMIATGELNLREGTYRSFGQDLIIRTGQIGFSGPIDKPYLNIKAIRNPDNTANDVIAGITLTGNIEQPALKVFSEPAMDQAESLAYLLNGQPLDEGDSSTDAMLTQLLLAQGVSRSEGVVSKVGETFGLSDVSLSSKGSGDETKVEISGYVAPGIQVKYSVGIFDSLSEVAVRYQLLSQLYIEITSGLYQNVDILYKFDLD